MNRFSTFILFLFSVTFAQAQAPASGNPKSDEFNLGFEMITDHNLPYIWLGAQQIKGYKIVCDTIEKHSGKRSLLIEKVDSKDASYMGQSLGVIPAKYEGKEIEVKAFLKFESVSEFVSLGVAVDDADYDRLKFEQVGYNKLKGSADWKEYSVKMPLSKDGRYIRIWPGLAGAGKLWVDDIRILIDGKDISQAKLKPDFDPVPKEYIPYGNNPKAGSQVKVKDASIYYETYGTGEPLLLLHGNSQSIYALKKQIITLSKYYKVIAVDTRGQGKSTDLSTDPLSYDLFASDMKTLLDSLHISKTNIYGWSDGGNTGLIMAYKFPSYVNKLAVMGANMFPTEEAISGSILKEVKKTIKGLNTKSDDKSKQQVRLFTLLLKEPHMTVDNLKEIKAPVLVMAGEKDMILEKHTKYIAAQLPSAQLVIFKGATHYAPVEVIEEFNNRLKAFFQ